MSTERADLPSRQSRFREIFECSECGVLFTAPRQDHRHAEGAAALGHYYPVRRLSVEVVKVSDVRWDGERYVYTERV